LYTPHAFYEARGRLNGVLKRIWDLTAEKFLIERGFRTIFLTDAWFGWLRDRGISPSRTSIIPNCVLESSLVTASSTASQPLAGRPSILTVGRLDPVKRVADVIRALAKPELEHAHFHVVGRGNQQTELERLSASLGVSHRVTFHGFVDDAGVASMMEMSDVFVLASEQEGLPTVLLEMLMSRQPVVCTRIPGNLAIMNVADQSSTYDVGDVSALAALLMRADKSSITEESIINLKKTFTWEHRSDELLELYQEALAP
jgi:glycosyltransferase involved in cell wall biosynthesis